MFCNTTVPDRLSSPLDQFVLGEPYESTTTTLNDQAPDRTDASYYTDGAPPSGVDKDWQPANMGGATVDWKKFTAEEWTRAGTFATTGSTVPTAPGFSQRISSHDATTTAAVSTDGSVTGASDASSSVVEASGAASTAGAVAGKDVNAAGGVLMGVLGAKALL